MVKAGVYVHVAHLAVLGLLTPLRFGDALRAFLPQTLVCSMYC